MNSALEEVDVFCREHEWIVEISNFVRTWNKSILASWRGRPPGKIEVYTYLNGIAIQLYIIYVTFS